MIILNPPLKIYTNYARIDQVTFGIPIKSSFRWIILILSRVIY